MVWAGSPPLGGMTSAVIVMDPASRLRCSAELKRRNASEGHYGRSRSAAMPKMVARLIQSVSMTKAEGADAMNVSLSARELEIIELVSEGLTNQEIAERLTISKRTVDNHVSNVFTKTGSKNRVALLNWAMDHGKICRDGFNCCSLPEASDDAS